LFDRRQVSRTACRGSPLILVGSDDTGDHRLVDDARVRPAWTLVSLDFRFRQQVPRAP
jgi:hypothetical protein